MLSHFFMVLFFIGFSVMIIKLVNCHIALKYQIITNDCFLSSCLKNCRPGPNSPYKPRLAVAKNPGLVVFLFHVFCCLVQIFLPPFAPSRIQTKQKINNKVWYKLASCFICTTNVVIHNSPPIATSKYAAWIQPPFRRLPRPLCEGTRNSLGKGTH